MSSPVQDEFVVFVRDNPDDSPWRHDMPERELVHCPTYEEAEWVRREYTRAGRRCIIRYFGPAGGGD